MHAEIEEHLNWDKVNLPRAIAPGTCVSHFSFDSAGRFNRRYGFQDFWERCQTTPRNDGKNKTVCISTNSTAVTR